VPAWHDAVQGGARKQEKVKAGVPGRVRRRHVAPDRPAHACMAKPLRHVHTQCEPCAIPQQCVLSQGGACVCVTQCERRPSLTWRTAEGLPRSGHRRRTLSPACSHTPSCNDTRCVWVAWLAGREGCKHKDTHNRIDAVCARRGVCI
jgi:hypothetical protein